MNKSLSLGFFFQELSSRACDALGSLAHGAPSYPSLLPGGNLSILPFGF